MFMVTNRNLTRSDDDLKKLGPKPNPKGPNELRLVQANKTAAGWTVDILPDRIDAKMKREIGLGGSGVVYASEYAAIKTLKNLQKKKRNLLFFVHGFNNDVEAVLERAAKFEQNYNLEVIPFSWPANGGGVKGVASYKSDKRDAKASVGALDRCFAKFSAFLQKFNELRVQEVYQSAEEKFPENMELRERYITEQAEKGCPFTVNMLAHSMGNYLFKHVLSSSIYRGTRLLFDNVVLAAADANNQNHTAWVDKIQARNRIYLTINEDDAALMASRMKAGQDQLARLGHYPYNLHSRQVAYIDFTAAPKVGRSHAYFEDALDNPRVKDYFDKALNGLRAEEGLVYDAARNLYSIKP